MGVWRGVREPLRDAVPPLQGPLVLPLRLQAVGKSQVSNKSQQHINNSINLDDLGTKDLGTTSLYQVGRPLVPKVL